MKKEARLTSSLLARKGHAAPSLATPKLSVPAIDRFGTGYVAADPVADVAPAQDVPMVPSETAQEASTPESFQQETVPEKAGGTAAETKNQPRKKQRSRERTPGGRSGQPAPKARSLTGQGRPMAAKPDPESGEDSGGKRIAMTLRMDKESHLRLRLYTAHSRKSCQEVLMEALEMYFEQHCCDLDKKNCSCLAE
ncbi:hypothetical protein [Luteithermobacter gelatinilyticus]|uniref:hypothetical protein n=1 Tax=Luteithermobacter gelatinilyticus TaxID=2582913 RepID=UPI00110617B2|nr:hypothetical protein [Luteithermobacter gelatinilyticus]